jgi:hypothetical protein
VVVACDLAAGAPAPWRLTLRADQPAIAVDEHGVRLGAITAIEPLRDAIRAIAGARPSTTFAVLVAPGASGRRLAEVLAALDGTPHQIAVTDGTGVARLVVDAVPLGGGAPAPLDRPRVTVGADLARASLPGTGDRAAPLDDPARLAALAAEIAGCAGCSPLVDVVLAANGDAAGLRRLADALAAAGVDRVRIATP